MISTDSSDWCRFLCVCSLISSAERADRGGEAALARLAHDAVGLPLRGLVALVLDAKFAVGHGISILS